MVLLGVNECVGSQSFALALKLLGGHEVVFTNIIHLRLGNGQVTTSHNFEGGIA